MKTLTEIKLTKDAANKRDSQGTASLERGTGRSSGGPEILLFGGTSEGREIAAGGLPVLYSVTTEYGAELADFPNVTPLVGRMDSEGMTALLKSRPVAGVIDATHPYAVEVTRNIRAACERTGVPRIRVLRGAWAEPEGFPPGSGVSGCLDCAEAAGLLQKLLPEKRGNALLTVGGKELEKFSVLPESLKRRVYVRVLPSSPIIAACEKLGFDAGHIIAMKGPFSRAMNAATLEMTGARILITKDGGAAGGLEEKLSAARELGVEVLLVRRPEEEAGVTVAEALEWGFTMLGLAGEKNYKTDGTSPHAPRLQAATCRGPGPLRIPSNHRFPFFSFFTDISGRRAVVIGGGRIAARRVKALLLCGACVTVVSPRFDAAFDAPELRNIERRVRAYRKGDLQNAALAVAATDERNVNRDAGAEARELGIPVSVADSAAECSFFFPAFVERDGIAAALSTGGRSPSLCRHLADRLRTVWPDWIKAEKEGLSHEEDH